MVRRPRRYARRAWDLECSAWERLVWMGESVGSWCKVSRASFSRPSLAKWETRLSKV
jgi:hypothetical protein